MHRPTVPHPAIHSQGENRPHQRNASPKTFPKHGRSLGEVSRQSNAAHHNTPDSRK